MIKITNDQSKGQNPAMNNNNFWDELFLLKVNVAFLERCIQLTGEEQLMLLKDRINDIVSHAVSTLQDSNTIRVKHALQVITNK